MRVTYVGPLDAVELADLHQVEVKRGDTVEVSDELGARLIEQSCWDAPPDELLAWVGKDTERAVRLLAAEHNGAQRAEVLTALEQIVNPPPKAADKPAAKPAGKKEG